MFCTNCGNSLGIGDNFCGQCGKAVQHAQTSVVQKPQTPRIEDPVVQIQPEYTPPIIPRPNKKAEAKSEKRREEMRAELKILLQKEKGRDVTDQELFEAEHWLRGYAELALDSYLEDKKRQKKLEENPKGFHLEGEGYTCFICGDHVSNEQTWYDKYGIKCLTCQSAIDKKIIPATAAENKDSWYSPLDLERSFFINRWGVKKLVKEGLLKPKIVPGSAGGVHYQMFFIKDHEGVLPPKKLTDWPMVKEQKDGEDYYHSEPWFMHADPKEVLKGYKILEYLATLEDKHIEKSFPQLTFQIPKGATSMMKVNHIEKKVEKTDDDQTPV